MKNSKKIDKIVKEDFFHCYSNNSGHRSLCSLFDDTEFVEEWDRFWKKINTKKHLTIACYYNKHRHIEDRYTEESALLRLLVVEDFKVYMDNKQQNKNGYKTKASLGQI